MKKNFKCVLLGGLGNQIFQHVILNWIHQELQKEIIISNFEFTRISNKIRNSRGIQSIFFYNYLNNNHIVKNDPMFLDQLFCRRKKSVLFNSKLVSDQLFLLGLKNGKDFLLEKLSQARFMRAHCVFPQVLNYSEFEGAWLTVLQKIQDQKKVKDLKMNDYDITVHLRRDDYLNFPEIYHQLNKFYFNNAIDILKEKLKIYGKPSCLVIGKDITWAKENLTDSIKATYQFKSEFFDFNSIMNSRNLILSNSSFSLAAARLAMLKKEVQNIICPKNYYVGDNDIGSINHKSWMLIE